MLPDSAGGPGVPVMDAPPAVRFGDGRRPETATHVQLASFDGPLGLLLSLIEGRQLDVLTVPLGSLSRGEAAGGGPVAAGGPSTSGATRARGRSSAGS